MREIEKINEPECIVLFKDLQTSVGLDVTYSDFREKEMLNSCLRLE